MSNYCTAADVSVLLGVDTFGATTRPTSTQVNSIIANVTNEIDFVLAAVGITTQPTDTKILGRLAIACKYGVAAQVGMSGYGNAMSVDNSQADKYQQRYQEILDEIKASPELYGQITGDSGMYMSGPVADGTWTSDEVEDRFLPDDYEY